MTPRLPWVRLAAAGSARVLLLSWACLALWACAPVVLGWQPTTVATGSMEPSIHVGDVVISKPATAAQAASGSGRVVLADDPDHAGRLRLHRFDHLTDDGDLVLKGDANAQADSTPVAASAVHGVGVVRVPWVGEPVVWLHEGRWTDLAALSAVAILLARATRLDRDLEGTDPAAVDRPVPDDLEPGRAAEVAAVAEHAGRHRAPHVLAPRLPALARGIRAIHVAWAVPALVLALASLLAVPGTAHAAFSGTTSSPAGGLATAEYFTCGNAVTAGHPSLYYRLDERGGSAAVDASAGRTDGVISSTGVTFQQSPAACADGGTAVTLNGSAGYVRSGQTFAYADTFTIETWFRTRTTRGGLLIGFGSSATGASAHHDRQLYLTGGGSIVFGVLPDKVQTISSGAGLNDGGWHLATATLSGAGMRLYVDGALVASNPSVTSAQHVKPATSRGYWRIGYDSLSGSPNRPSSDWFAGTVDDAAVYPSALSADEVAAHYLAR